MFSWQNPEFECLRKTCTKNNNDYNNKQTESSWGLKNDLWVLVVCLTVSACERCCISATDLDLDYDDLQTDHFQSGSCCVLPHWLIFQFSLVLAWDFWACFLSKHEWKKKMGSQMGCNTRAAFSSWVYKNICKIVSIYDSAWRSGVDVSLKVAAAESLRMVPKLTFIWFRKKCCFTCWKLDQL